MTVHTPQVRETDGTGLTLIQAIGHHAQTDGRKCAVADSTLKIDYAGLESFSNHFANILTSMGRMPGDRVVMLANRSAVLVASIIGTFKAGCTHVPLDPKMPAGRLEYILSDIVPFMVITESDLVETVRAHAPEGTKIWTVEDLKRELEVSKRSANGIVISDKALRYNVNAPAYCIYTSGSTGHPKGVVINHTSFTPFFEGTKETYDVSASSICASFSPLHFDVYLMDMLFPLYEGAELHVHDDVVVPDFLFDTIKSNNVTHFSAWGMMLGLIAQAEEFDEATLPSLRTILTGTDVPDIKTVQRWMQKNDGVRVINAYGPTEVTCASVAHLIEDIEPDRKELYPIGKPLKHVSARRIDEDENIIHDVGVQGELLVGGVQVMRGYWNKDTQTAERIAYDGDIRFYRTGDVCSYLNNGDIYYHGRKDNEVNIGGYRVHLNEIQRVICSVNHVHSAEIMVTQSAVGEKILVAGALLEQGRFGDAETIVAAIEAQVSKELQAYMHPRHTIAFDQFPQLSSGKADRKKLLILIEEEIARKAGA